MARAAAGASSSLAARISSFLVSPLVSAHPSSCGPQELEDEDDPAHTARARLPEVPEHTFLEMLAVVAAAPFEIERLILLKALRASLHTLDSRLTAPQAARLALTFDRPGGTFTKALRVLRTCCPVSRAQFYNSVVVPCRPCGAEAEREYRRAMHHKKADKREPAKHILLQLEELEERGSGIDAQGQCANWRALAHALLPPTADGATHDDLELSERSLMPQK